MSFGGNSISTETPTPYGSIRIQTSTQGVCIPVILGTQRITGNLIWAGDFQAQAVSSGGGGKGGGGKGGVSSYEYYSSYQMGICEGPIVGIGQVWNGKAVLSAPSSDMVISLGAYPQLPWGYLITNHLSQALAYPGIAYCAIPNADLGSSNTLPQTSFEVQGLNRLSGTQASKAVYTIAEDNTVTVSPYEIYVADIGVTYQATGISLTKVGSNPSTGQYSIGTGTNAGIYYFNSGDQGNNVIIQCQLDMQDANPATIITQMITNVHFGIYANFPLDVTDYANWCLAANLLLSVAATAQQSLSSYIDSILEESFSTCIPHDGKTLQFKTYGDTAMTANGATWTPDLTPLYDLMDDDFVADTGQLPITVTRKSSADSYNDYRTQFTDRANSYNTGIAGWMDQGNIDLYMRRPDDTRQYQDICQMGIAQKVIQLNGQKNLYAKNRYEFTLKYNYDLLECMDIITLTDSGLGLNKFPVRIIEIEEDESFNRKITAEEFPEGMGNVIENTHESPAGLITNTNIEPGSVNTPYIFNAPGILTSSGYEVWAAVSGGENWGGCDVYISTDGTTYKLAGTVYGGSRYGVLTAILPVRTDPDTTDALSVDLTTSKGTLLSGIQSDADNFITLCLLNNELVSFETATLTGTYQYDLTYLRRGAYNSPISSHAIDSPFVRVDDTVFKYPFTKTQLGQTIFIKFCSFNKYQLNKQSLADVTPYSYVIANSLSYPANVSGFKAVQSGDFVAFTWDNITDQNVDGYTAYGSLNWNNGIIITKVEAGSHLVTANVPIGNWTFYIAAIDYSGNYSVTPSSTSLNVVSTSAIVAGGVDLSTLGWPGTGSNIVITWDGKITLKSQGVAAADDWNTFDELVPNPYASGSFQASEIALGRDRMVRAYALAASSGASPSIELNYHIFGGSYPGFVPWTIGYLYDSNFQFEFVLADPTAVITQFIPTLDANKTTQNFNNVSIDVGGTTITFSPAFNAPPNVIATVVGSTGYTANVSAGVTANSCVVIIYNNSGVSVAGVANVKAEGI